MHERRLPVLNLIKEALRNACDLRLHLHGADSRQTQAPKQYIALRRLHGLILTFWTICGQLTLWLCVIQRAVLSSIMAYKPIYLLTDRLLGFSDFSALGLNVISSQRSPGRRLWLLFLAIRLCGSRFRWL
jgi:hypothetical protein